MSSAGDKVRVGVSACLLGQKVRYDGEHKRAAGLLAELGPFVEWVPVCPEVEVGMGIPRESVRLVGVPRGAGLRMLGNDTGADWTERMTRFACQRVQALAPLGLAGYVLKSRSPSCGLAQVKVFDARRPEAEPRLEGVGLFAQALREHFPDLPMEDEERLGDARVRARFIERLLAYRDERHL